MTIDDFEPIFESGNSLLKNQNIKINCSDYTYDQFKSDALELVSLNDDLNQDNRENLFARWEWVENETTRKGKGYIVKKFPCEKKYSKESSSCFVSTGTLGMYVNTKAKTLTSKEVLIVEEEDDMEEDIGMMALKMTNEEQEIEFTTTVYHDCRHLQVSNESEQIEFHIVYSVIWQRPVLFIKFNSITEEYVNSLLSIKQYESVRSSMIYQTISLQDHPILQIPFYYVHPCQSMEVLRELISSSIDHEHHHHHEHLGLKRSDDNNGSSSIDYYSHSYDDDVHGLPFLRSSKGKSFHNEKSNFLRSWLEFHQFLFPTSEI